MKKLLLLVFICLPFKFAMAAENPRFTITPATDKPALGEVLLKLTIQDAQAKSGVCLYYVRDLQYLPALKVLSVEVYQENCVNDAYGISKGEAQWVVPATLLTTGQEIKVLVNQTEGGSLVFDSGSKNFHVKN